MRIKRLFSNYYWDFNEVKNILENLKIKFGCKRPFTHPGARETRKAMEGWSLTWLPGNLIQGFHPPLGGGLFTTPPAWRGWVGGLVGGVCWPVNGEGSHPLQENTASMQSF